MKKLLVIIFLTAVAWGSAFGQAPSSVAGFTLYEDTIQLASVESQTAIDLHQDGTYAIRFTLAGKLSPFTGSPAFYGSPSPTSGTYAYTVSSSNIASLSLSGPSDLFPLPPFSNSYQGGGGQNGGSVPATQTTFSLAPTGGDPSTRALVNMSILISARQGSPMSFGFVVGGTRAREILIRAVGPSLASFGIANFAPNPAYVLNGGPAFQLPGESGQFPATGWSATVASTTTLSTEASRVGAFPLIPGSNDKADVVLLAPGAYTITVNPTDPTQEGAELIEVYEVE
jgi:hypothetical protein